MWCVNLWDSRFGSGAFVVKCLPLKCELLCIVMMVVGVGMWDKDSSGSEKVPQRWGFRMTQAP